jgi:hypothetical protein
LVHGHEFRGSTDELGFITADSPCVWFDPKARNPFPFNHPGLGCETVEVTLPMSRSRVLLFSWSDVRRYADVNHPDGVDEINVEQEVICSEYFVVPRNQTRPTWFKFVPRTADRPTL